MLRFRKTLNGIYDCREYKKKRANEFEKAKGALG